MAVNRLNLTQGNLYQYTGTDGSYSLLLGGVNRVDESDLVISGSSYLGDSSSDRVQITGSLKSRHITGSIHTVNGVTPFITQGSNTTVAFSNATGQWTISSTGGGGGTPGGSDTQVQFNDGGSTFGGDSGLTFNKTTDTLSGVTGSFYRVVATDLSASSGNLNLSLGASGKVTVAGNLEIDGNNILASNGSTNITLTSNTLTTFAGDIKVTGNDIQSSTGTAISLSGVSATVAGDLQVTGNQIKSNTGAVALQLTGSDVTVGSNLVVSGSSKFGNDASDITVVTGSFLSRNITGSLSTVDGSTAFLAQSGNATVSFNNSTGQWTIGASGGGTPGGAGNQVQLANAGGSAFSGSGGLWYTSSGNRLYVSGGLVIGGTDTIDIPSTKNINLFPTLGNNTLTIGQTSYSKLIVGAQMGVYNGINISGNDIKSSSGATAITVGSSDTEFKGRTFHNGDMESNVASLNVFNTATSTTVQIAGYATTLNIGGTFSSTAAQTVTIGGTSTGASTYNIGTGPSSNGNNKTVNIGTGNAAGSKTIINLGTSQGGKTSVSGSFSYKGDVYASDIQLVSANTGVSGAARYVRFTAAATLSLPALSESVHGRVLTITNAISAGGNGIIAPDGSENVIVLGTTGLGSVTLSVQRQWVELVAKFISGGNDNGWYAVCGGVIPTLD
jgi:hypothetical protein